MKFNVVSKFKEASSGKFYFPGETYETEDEEKIKKIIEKELAIEVEEKTTSKLTKEEICELLKEKEIEFDPKTKKEELLTILGDSKI